MFFKSNKDKRQVERLANFFATEFHWDTEVKEHFRRYISGELADHLEFISDAEGSANWRIKRDKRLGAKGLRVAYYGNNPEKETRAARINEELALLYQTSLMGLSKR